MTPRPTIPKFKPSKPVIEQIAEEAFEIARKIGSPDASCPLCCVRLPSPGTMRWHIRHVHLAEALQNSPEKGLTPNGF